MMKLNGKSRLKQAKYNTTWQYSATELSKKDTSLSINSVVRLIRRSRIKDVEITDYPDMYCTPCERRLSISAAFLVLLLIESHCLAAMDFIEVSDDGGRFILDKTQTTFTPWGVNYDHDTDGRLIEDYWQDEWPTIEEDFREIKQLGANVVRIHLQFGKFMPEPDTFDAAQLARLTDLLKLAEETRLYLDLTGLACYHKKDVPAWYNELPEKDRWDMQALFWEVVARTCAERPAVFCYDLMNEPVLSGEKKESDWLLGELGGKFFVQRLNLELAGRTRKQIAKAWVNKMVAAIRKHDRRHLITVGVIPWATVWPHAKPVFYSPEVSENLDFVSVHFYPESGQLEKALAALKVYDIGKPLVVEEMFPLKCTAKELRQFVLESRGTADGWISFYWGRTIQQYESDEGVGPAVIRDWLTTFKQTTEQVVRPTRE